MKGTYRLLPLPFRGEGRGEGMFAISTTEIRILHLLPLSQPSPLKGRGL
jgi:hypothetical protein